MSLSEEIKMRISHNITLHYAYNAKAAFIAAKTPKLFNHNFAFCMNSTFLFTHILWCK